MYLFVNFDKKEYIPFCYNDVHAFSSIDENLFLSSYYMEHVVDLFCTTWKGDRVYFVDAFSTHSNFIKSLLLDELKIKTFFTLDNFTDISSIDKSHLVFPKRYLCNSITKEFIDLTSLPLLTRESFANNKKLFLFPLPFLLGLDIKDTSLAGKWCDSPEGVKFTAIRPQSYREINFLYY